MATNTTNLNLKKPAGTDYVLVSDFNTNADTLDAAIGDLGQLQTSIKTDLVAAVNEANASSSYPPYIGVNKHWYVWNSGLAQYTDSGVVAEGVDGAPGISAYVWIKWSAVQPTQDSHMKGTPDAYIGVYAGSASTAPTGYLSYTWYRYKGEIGLTGDTGPANSLAIGTVQKGESAAATITGAAPSQTLNLVLPKGDPSTVPGPTGNGISSVTLISGTHAPGTSDTYRITMTSGATYDFAVYNGADGQGAGDMLASVYADSPGVVKDSAKFGGQLPAYYAAATDIPTGALASKDTVAAADIADDAVIAAKIKNAEVTNAKLANMDAYTFKGRLASTGAPTDNTLLDGVEYALHQGTATTSPADTEFIPLNVSATSLKKITWANVKAALKTALFGSVSGLAKLDGSGGVSAAVAGTDYATPAVDYAAALSTAWTGSGPYTQAVTVTGLSASAKIFVGLADNATDAEYAAAVAAQLMCTAKAANQITVTARGEKPTIALPIIVRVVI